MTEIHEEIGPPIQAVVKASERITPVDMEEVRHLTLEVDERSGQFAEGLSIGIPAPGSEGETETSPQRLRRYSIANVRKVPFGDGVLLDLLIRRCFGLDSVPGATSNYLCDAKPGDLIQIHGPYRSPFRMPLDNRANLLMIGAGTGIAPFRAFVHQVSGRSREWHGQVRLYYGARSGLDLMYVNDESADLDDYYDEKTFRAFCALGNCVTSTGEADSSQSSPMTDDLEGHIQDVWRLVNEPNTHVFLSGLHSATDGFDELMAEQAGSAEAWSRLKQRLIEEGRWSELTYD